MKGSLEATSGLSGKGVIELVHLSLKRQTKGATNGESEDTKHPTDTSTRQPEWMDG